MTTLETIVAELKRQHEASGAFGLSWLDIEDQEAAMIDGQVDLIALAAAIDAGRRGSFIDPNTTEVTVGKTRLYEGKIEPGMLFTWMKGTEGECSIKVTRVSDKCPDDPWVYAEVLSAADRRLVGKEYGNETSRFREAVEPAS